LIRSQTDEYEKISTEQAIRETLGGFWYSYY
jgi:hypothetical protein